MTKFLTQFHMSNDSHLFRSRDDLESAGATLGEDGHFHRPAGTGSTLDPGTTEWLPLYEAKLIHQYDHRFATYAPDGSTRDVTPAEHGDPDFFITPRYWVAQSEIDKRLSNTPLDRPWMLTFRDIARATDARTVVCALFPRSGAGNHLLGFNQATVEQVCGFVANLNAFAFDFACRQKVGGTHLNFFLVKQFPVLPPETYTPELLASIVPRVLELTYTAHDMAPFARDLGYEGPPFTWDEDRRAQLRADLDGIYAHLYQLSRDDFAYILDTFPIVASNDIKAHGEYRTKRLCLEAYDRFAPETLRALELRVRAIERTLRSRIVQAAGDDVEALPTGMRLRLQEEFAKRNRDGATPTLRQLLDASYLTSLEKIARADSIWPNLDIQTRSKGEFRDAIADLAAFRNPMAHANDPSEADRTKGETAVRWFEARLGIG
jgi:hypothetical protein